MKYSIIYYNPNFKILMHLLTDMCSWRVSDCWLGLHLWWRHRWMHWWVEGLIVQVEFLWLWTKSIVWKSGEVRFGGFGLFPLVIERRSPFTLQWGNPDHWKLLNNSGWVSCSPLLEQAYLPALSCSPAGEPGAPQGGVFLFPDFDTSLRWDPHQI